MLNERELFKLVFNLSLLKMFQGELKERCMTFFSSVTRARVEEEEEEEEDGNGNKTKRDGGNSRL